MDEVGNIQKRTLLFALDNFESDYETLLLKSSKCTIEIRRLRSIPLEAYLLPKLFESAFSAKYAHKK